MVQDKFGNILNRATIESIAHYLLNGDESMEQKFYTEETLKNYRIEILDKIYNNNNINENDKENFLEMFDKILIAYEEQFFLLGLKAGVKLMIEKET